jgi:pilus assembly protein CpaD
MKHLVMLALFLGVTACQDRIVSEAQPLRQPKQMFPIEVEPYVETLTLPAAAPGLGISDATAAQVGAFTANYMRRGHGKLVIETAAGPVSKESLAQLKAVNSILAGYGVPLARMEWRTLGATPAAAPAQIAPGGSATRGTAKGTVNPLVLRYTRYVASLAPCGDWSKDTASAHDNQPTANFGCATQHNLAVMVSDPADLKQPRQMDDSSVTRRATVIERYRQGQATSTPRGLDEKGTVSEVAR